MRSGLWTFFVRVYGLEYTLILCQSIADRQWPTGSRRSVYLPTQYHGDGAVSPAYNEREAFESNKTILLR